MGEDKKKSLADQMKSKDDDSKRDTQESASLKDRITMKDEDFDASAVTRPSREGITEQLKDALERGKEEAQDDDEPKTLAEKLREAKEGLDDDDEPQSLADKMRDQDDD